MNMQTSGVGQSAPPDQTAQAAPAAENDGRVRSLNQDSRNSVPGREYFQTTPEGNIKVSVSTNDRAADATNGNRAEVHNTQFSGEGEPNDFESWITVHEGHSFSVAQLLNHGTDGASPDVMFTVEKGEPGQPNILVVQGRKVDKRIIGPLPPDGRFKIEMKTDGAGNFSAQVYVGASEETKVPFGDPIVGELSNSKGPLQFRSGIYFDGYNNTTAYPADMEPVNGSVTLEGTSVAYRTGNDSGMETSRL